MHATGEGIEKVTIGSNTVTFYSLELGLQVCIILDTFWASKGYWAHIGIYGQNYFCPHEVSLGITGVTSL